MKNEETLNPLREVRVSIVTWQRGGISIYNEADTVYMVFLTDTPLSCLHLTLWQSVEIKHTVLQNLKSLEAIFLLAKPWILVGVWYKERPPVCSTMRPDGEHVPVCSTKTRNSSALLCSKPESWEEERDMGEAPRGTELSDIPVKCTGIKPGVKLLLLFRLDTTKKGAIWQTIRQLNAAFLCVVFVLGKSWHWKPQKRRTPFKYEFNTAALMLVTQLKSKMTHTWS